MNSSGCKIKRVGSTISDATGYGRAAQDERIPRPASFDFDSRRLHQFLLGRSEVYRAKAAETKVNERRRELIPRREPGYGAAGTQ